MPVKYNSEIKAEVVSQDDDVTIARVLVTPFGSPSKKDLHGEFFHKETYFGDDVINVKFGLYEHLLNSMSNPFMTSDVKKHVLGKATLAKTDEWGRWYDFEIRRSLEYHDLLTDLIGKGLMGASTQCFPNGKTVDPTIKGKIDVWLENEVSLTPTPAAPDTVKAEDGEQSTEKTNVKAQIYALAKQHGFPIQMVKNGEVVDFVEESDNIEENDDVVSDAESDFDSEQYAQEIQDVLEGKSSTTDVEEEPEPVLSGEEDVKSEAISELLQTVKDLRNEVHTMKASMFAYFEIWGNDMQDAKEAVNELLGNASTSAKSTEVLSRINRKVDGLTKAQTHFAHYMKAFKEGEAGRRWERMSAMEREMVDEFDNNDDAARPKNYTEELFQTAIFPEGAPGG